MPGKIDASLNEKLKNIQWGEYRLGDLFHKRTIKGIPKSEENLIENPKGYHVFGQNIYYQYPQRVLNDNKYLTQVEPGKPIIAYTSSTAQIGIINESFYRTGDNGAFQGLFPKFEQCNYNQILFILVAIKRKFIGLGYNDSMAHVMDLYIKLPIYNGEIDFAYMDSFVAELKAQHVAELKAYLSITGLDNYELTEDEQNILDMLANSKMDFSDVTFSRIFDCIKQGRRLKKDDQKEGKIPFIMSGVTNTGVVNYISNPVAIFPKNSITLDIFGNAFYRNFEFGAGDDTGVYWSETEEYSSKSMLFFTTAMNVAVAGQYSYGHKLRSSKSLDLTMKLPVINGKMDITTMELLISAVQKLVIKDVVLYAKSKESLTKTVIK